ncbi:MAG: hypothetical protein GVY28_05115, partial [Alphaproteobacteria bacterium]|nr:hypothetical protein [Alphaproteobacteria bacterium]
MTDTRDGDTSSLENEPSSASSTADGEDRAPTARPRRAFAALSDFFDSDFARLAGAGFLISLAAVLAMSLLSLLIGVLDTSSRAAAAIQAATSLATVMVAVSLVAVLMAKVDNVVVRGVGILLIGALIVPTTDLVRFWLLASGSDRNIADFYPEAESGGTKIGGDGTLALRVLIELEERGVVRDFAEREFAVVREAIAAYDIQQTHEAVVGNGALPLLIAVRDGEVGTWIMRDNADSRFREAMTYLRRQGLISFPYDAYADAKTTLRGNAVAAFEGYRFPRPADAVEGLPGGHGGPFDVFDAPDTADPAPAAPAGGSAGWPGWIGLSQPADSAVTPIALVPGADAPQRETGSVRADGY